MTWFSVSAINTDSLRSTHKCFGPFIVTSRGLAVGVTPPALPVPTTVRIFPFVSTTRNDRFFVKVYLNPSLPTDGIVDDPDLHIPSVCGVWPGAEWNEREAFDMFGVRFDGHPDHRRILTWEAYPAHPLRKDYPLRGRGEREAYKVIDRTDA